MTTVAEVSEVAEGIENLIWITEDVYHARVYATPLRVLRADLWRTSVDRKIDVVRENYRVLPDEVNREHGNFLEWVIIVLIALEFAFAIRGRSAPEPESYRFRPRRSGLPPGRRKKSQIWVKSQTVSAKSIRPLRLKSNDDTGSFVAIQPTWLKYSTTSEKSFRPFPFTSSQRPSPSVSVGTPLPPGIAVSWDDEPVYCASG